MPTINDKVKFLLDWVAQGNQKEAENYLNLIPANKQMLLNTAATFTDKSDRTFTCTAYEYAYWAKDSKMCRLLQSYMDEDTKACLLKRMENTDSNGGLSYKHRGTPLCSQHFDISPLIQAINDCGKYSYISPFDPDYENKMKKHQAFKNSLGGSLHDAPVHVEKYCLHDLRIIWSLYPTTHHPENDMAALIQLDKMNTAELWKLHDSLKPSELPNCSMM